MLVYTTQGQPDCRLAVVPVCELDTDPSQSATIDALAVFQLRIRDTIDFRVDWSRWLAANGGASLSAATFAIAETSPSEPTIAAQAFSAAGMCVVALQAGAGETAAKAGDAYWLDLTVTVAATTPASPSDVAIPARTLVRRIHVVVVNG